MRDKSTGVLSEGGLRPRLRRGSEGSALML